MHATAAPPRSSGEPPRPIAKALGLLAAALLVFAPLLGLKAWESVRRDRLADFHNVAGLAARSADLALQRVEHGLSTLAAQLPAEVSNAPGSDTARRLAEHRARLPGLVALDLLRGDGVLLASDAADDAPPLPQRRDHGPASAGRAAFPAAGLQPGRPFRWQAAQAMVLPVAVSVASPVGERPGAFLLALVDLRRLEALWGHPQLPAGAILGLVTDRGEAMPAVPAGQPLADVLSVALAERVMRRAAAVDTFDAGGLLQPEPRTVVLERLPGYGLVAFVAVPQRALWLSWFERVRLPFALLALAISGLVLAAVWARRQQQARESERDFSDGLLREQASQMRRQAALLAQTQRAARIGGWELDVAAGSLYWTDETYRIHGLEPGGFTPDLESTLQFVSPDDRENLRAAIERAAHEPQHWGLEVELLAAGGRRIWVEVTGVSEAGPGGPPAKVSGSYQDITERRHAEDEIRRLAHYDELTGLANRNLFTHHLGRAMVRAQRHRSHLAVIFIDLDRFKNINDTLGHDAGDQLLQRIGQRLARSMRASDLVARLGGDEFVVLVDDLEDPALVADIAAKLLRLIEQPVQIHGRELAVTASIGIATYPADGQDLQSLLKHADIAMYRAKDEGRNRFARYSPDIETTHPDRLALEARLKKAVVEGGQFLLHYQPKMSVGDGRIVGAEALVRWLGPDGRILPPDAFIPLAEETGLIAAIGEWVLRTACRHAAGWAAMGLPPVSVAVNLSPRQFHSADFLPGVRRILAETGVDPSRVELELTESAVMHDVEHVALLLTELKGMGLRIAVDDFGTGYSSLGYLKRLPLDALKVDRSFIRDVPGDQDDVAITRAVVAMAHSLRLTVVGEGVETEEQLAFLRQIGCDEMQGFLFSRPVDVAEFEAMLRRGARLVPQEHRDAA